MEVDICSNFIRNSERVKRHMWPRRRRKQEGRIIFYHIKFNVRDNRNKQLATYKNNVIRVPKISIEL